MVVIDGRQKAPAAATRDMFKTGSTDVHFGNYRSFIFFFKQYLTKTNE